MKASYGTDGQLRCVDDSYAASLTSLIDRHSGIEGLRGFLLFYVVARSVARRNHPYRSSEYRRSSGGHDSSKVHTSGGREAAWKAPLALDAIRLYGDSLLNAPCHLSSEVRRSVPWFNPGGDAPAR